MHSSTAIRNIFASIVLAAVSFYGIGNADATTAYTTVTNGTRCQPAKASKDQVDYNQFGIFNTSATTAATVFCEIPGRAQSTDSAHYTSIAINYYDRNTTSDVSCFVQVLDGGGNDAITPLSLTSSGGGPGSGLQSFTPSLPSVSSILPVYVTCTLPPAQSGWVSVLTTMTIFAST